MDSSRALGTSLEHLRTVVISDYSFAETRSRGLAGINQACFWVSASGTHLGTLMHGHCRFVCLTKSVYSGRCAYRMENYSYWSNQKVIHIWCWVYSAFYVVIFIEVFLMTGINIAWSNVLRSFLVSFCLNTEVDRAPETSDIPLNRQWATSKDNIAVKYYTTFTNGPPHYAFLTYLTIWNIVTKMNIIYHLYNHCPVGSATPALVICRNAGVFRELLADFS